METMSRTRLAVLGFGLILATAFTSQSRASLVGTVPTVPNTSVIPGVATGNAGTLLADETVPYSYSTTAGTTSGTLASAVFQEAGGTLDFYYQISNNAVSATPIERQVATSFVGFLTSLGFRTDGASLAGTNFVNGTVAPVGADRDPGGTTIGFNFNPPIQDAIAPGATSDVLVISTNATNFTAGNAAVIDGGSQTLAAFQPAVPEPASLATCVILGAGLMLRRRRA